MVCSFVILDIPILVDVVPMFRRCFGKPLAKRLHYTKCERLFLFHQLAVHRLQPGSALLIFGDTGTMWTWLVVYLPLWKMMEFVSWDYILFPTEEKKCSKPPTMWTSFKPRIYRNFLRFPQIEDIHENLRHGCHRIKTYKHPDDFGMVTMKLFVFHIILLVSGL